MREKKLRTVGAVLLVAAIMPLVFIISFFVQKSLIQHEMKERLEEEQIQTLSLHTDQFRWIKNGKEIKIGNKMFDVKSFSVQGNIWCFHGLFDEDETLLVKNLTDNFHRNEHGKQILVLLIQLMQNSFFENGAGVNTLCNASLPGSIFHTGKIPVIYQSILTPPPQVINLLIV